MDFYWKVARGRSVVLQGYKDEIATSKHKPSRTVVHKHQWLPMGERLSEDKDRADYGYELLRMLKTLLNGFGVSANQHLRKVTDYVSKDNSISHPDCALSGCGSRMRTRR